MVPMELVTVAGSLGDMAYAALRFKHNSEWYTLRLSEYEYSKLRASLAGSDTIAAEDFGGDRGYSAIAELFRVDVAAGRGVMDDFDISALEQGLTIIWNCHSTSWRCKPAMLRGFSLAVALSHMEENPAICADIMWLSAVALQRWVDE